METIFNKIKFDFYKISKDDDGGFQIQYGKPNEGIFQHALDEIDRYNCQDGDRVINILFFNIENLDRGFINFLLDEFKYSLGSNNEPYNPIPLISICDDAIMVEQKNFPKKCLSFFDPRYRFLDSSIWFRNLSVNKLETFQTRFEHVLNDVNWAYDKGLFYSTSAIEYLEYHTRLFKVSILEDFGDKGHASKTTPFIFHSESVMQKRANRLRAKIFENKGLRWSFLLVDDFAKKSLSKFRSTNKIAKKGDIILELINVKDKLSISNNAMIGEVGPEKFIRKNRIDSGLEYLEKSSCIPDIILLDFLFNNPKKTRYGDEFLEKLSDPLQNYKYKKGPFDKYWIFPITVFSDAMLSSLQEKNIQNIKQDWNLARGADPINTPHKFRADLFEFLTVLMVKGAFVPEDFFSFLINKNVVGKSGEITKELARRLFGKFSSKFIGLEDIAILNSSFAESVRQFGDNEKSGSLDFDDLLGLMKSIRRLLFLLGYRNIDGPSMVRELDEIRSYFNRAKSSINLTSKEKQGVDDFFNRVEGFLQNQ